MGVSVRAGSQLMTTPSTATQSDAEDASVVFSHVSRIFTTVNYSFQSYLSPQILWDPPTVEFTVLEINSRWFGRQPHLC